MQADGEGRQNIPLQMMSSVVHFVHTYQILDVTFLHVSRSPQKGRNLRTEPEHKRTEKRRRRQTAKSERMRSTSTR